MTIYADALGVGSLSPIQAEQVRHAAQLAAMAELARARLVEGDTSTINDVIRLENSAGRAFKALGIREAEPAAKPQSTPLADYLSKRGPSCER